MISSFSISPNGITIGERTFVTPINAAWFVKCIERDHRIASMDTDTPGLPETAVFDDVGIFIRWDKPSGRIATITFVFRPEDFPFHPKTGFSGSLVINGVRVNADMTEETAPLHGELHFKKWSALNYSAESGGLYVSLRFARVKKSAVRTASHRAVLASVEFSFSVLIVPKAMIAERLAKN